MVITATGRINFENEKQQEKVVVCLDCEGVVFRWEVLYARPHTQT